MVECEDGETKEKKIDLHSKHELSFVVDRRVVAPGKLWLFLPP